MFSDESLDAFRSATEDGDFEPLSRIFKGGHFKSIKSEIYAKSGMRMHDPVHLDRVRQMLNMNFGANF